jgi:hypothetical protein
MVVARILENLCTPAYMGYTKDTVKPGYNDMGLSDTSRITSHVTWYQLIPHY